MTRTLTRLAATTLALTLPFTALAAAMLQAGDSIAGLGIDVSLSGAEAVKPVTFTVQDPRGVITTLNAQTDANGNAVATLPGTKNATAGSYAIRATQGATPISPVTAKVDPDTMDSRTSTIQSWTPSIRADGYDEAEITVTLRDRYGNALAGRPVAVVSGRATDKVSAVTPETGADGTQHFVLTTQEPGIVQLRAVDLLSGNAVNESARVDAGGYAMGGYETAYAANGGARTFYPVNSAAPAPSYGQPYSPYAAQLAPAFGILDHFEITVPPSVNAGEDIPKFTVTAVDRDGRVMLDYNGKILFSSTDAQATMPGFGSYTFVPRDQGKKDFFLGLNFRTGGQQTLRVEDSSDTRIYGEATVTVSGAGSGPRGSIEVTSHKDGDYVNSANIIVSGQGPRLANIRVLGGERDFTTGTDDTGLFSIPVTLDPAKRDHQLRVMDDTGRNDSGPINLILDADAPTIGTVLFTPENPQEGDQVLVMVEAESGLSQVTINLPDPTNGMKNETKLSPSTLTGSYQAFFTAPRSGLYQPVITVMDRAGNVEEVRAQLNIGGKTLPVVQNLKAEARVDAVELSWDAVTGDVFGYRVYVGDSISNYLYSLDTGRAITKATVKGLVPGQTYFFAVTAVRDGIESEEKSEPVRAQVLGFNLEVEEEESALHVMWTSLSTDLPLASFLLEYGTDATVLGETRMLNGELRDFTIRDLIPGVTYYVQVTPITVTGDKLEELSAKGQGAPGGTGFKPGPRDDVPFDPVKNPGGTLHPAPSNPASGIPAAAWMTAVALGAAGVWYRWHRRRNLSKTQAFLQAVQNQYRG
jgi:hypothetical protein